MKRFVLLVFVLVGSLAAALPVGAQNRSAELDAAFQEARSAYNDWQRAIARRDEGIESQAGERQASAAGGSRPNANYFARQAILEQDVETTRKRYEAAMKRWNDLK